MYMYKLEDLFFNIETNLLYFHVFICRQTPTSGGKFQGS